MNLDTIELNNKGRYLSMLLRHKPEKENLTMDKNGWVPISEVLFKLGISRMGLDWIVENNNKKRFVYNIDGDKIRASQGHSVNVTIEMELYRLETGKLYHGTKEPNVPSILKNGLLKQKRQHVHLSEDVDTAIKVGSRHGKPTVLVIDAPRMRADGVKIYVSANGVYLTEYVEPKYISKL